MSRDIDVNNLPRVLTHEWRKSKSVPKLKAILNDVVNECGLRFYDLQGNERSMDKICCCRVTDKMPPIITSLVKVCAIPDLIPELKCRYDVIKECIKGYDFGDQRRRLVPGSVVDYVTVLLKHGAKLNKVKRTESGVRVV